MHRRLATMCLAVTIAVGTTSSPVVAQDNNFSRATLKGISIVPVVVENLPPGASALGLTKDVIQTDVELKLRLAGMRVVTPGDSANLPGGQFYM